MFKLRRVSSQAALPAPCLRSAECRADLESKPAELDFCEKDYFNPKPSKTSLKQQALSTSTSDVVLLVQVHVYTLAELSLARVLARRVYCPADGEERGAVVSQGRPGGPERGERRERRGGEGRGGEVVGEELRVCLSGGAAERR